MAHGYLGEGYGMWGEFDPDEEGRERDRDRDWRERDRDRGFMFGDRERFRGGRSEDEREWLQGRRDFGPNPHEHYLSWRDRQMAALDSDYADYCRERERQFHQDFDSWRSERHGNRQPLQTGMTPSGQSADPTGITEAENETAATAQNDEDPMSAATLGTTSGGRGRR